MFRTVVVANERHLMGTSTEYKKVKGKNSPVRFYPKFGIVDKMVANFVKTMPI